MASPAAEYELGQTWTVRFKSEGARAFRELCGRETSIPDRSIRVSIPPQKERTGTEVVEQVRYAAITALAEQCQRDDIDISFNQLLNLNSGDFLEGSLKDVFEPES